MSRGLLFLRLGGACVASLVHQALGAPALSMLHTAARSTVASLSPLAGFPSKSEIQHNIRAAFKNSCGNTGCGYVLMVDEIKVEERMQWDPSNNKVLGLCWEHTGHVGLEFCLMSNARALVHGILCGDMHHASEVSACLIVNVVSMTNTSIPLHAGRQLFFPLVSFQRIDMPGAHGPLLSQGPANGRAMRDMCNLFRLSLMPVMQKV